MILCEFTPSGDSLIRMSNRWLNLTNPWKGYIISFGNFKVQTEFLYGGYIKPAVSSMKIAWAAFISVPPPTLADVTIKITESTEALAALKFDGTAILSEYDSTGIVYSLRAKEFSTVSPALTNIPSVSLDTWFTTICGASYLNLTLDDTDIRATPPEIDYQLTQDMPDIELASNIAAWFCHGFTIEDGTLTLFDLLGTKTATELTSFDFKRIKYKRRKPVSLFVSEDYSVAGSYTTGDSMSITPYYSRIPNIEDDLANIKTCMERTVMRVPVKALSSSPKAGDYVSIVDNTFPDSLGSITAEGWVMSSIYNFNNKNLELEILGTVS